MKRNNYLISGILCTALAFGSFTTLTQGPVSASVINDSFVDYDNIGVGNFIIRLYRITLERDADDEGFTYWYDLLTAGQTTGAEVAKNFIFSNEFQSKKMSNSEYLETMYSCFFGRYADPTGLDYWLAQMNSGTSREEIFNGFAYSQEFDDICKSYEIKRGDAPQFKVDVNSGTGTERFVKRLYKTILARDCDPEGLKSWRDELDSGRLTGVACAYGFIFSDEYRKQNKSNEDYIEDLYMALLGRASDADGKNSWKSQYSRSDMLFTDFDAFNGFANSPEFQNICAEYGIVHGGAMGSGIKSARSNVSFEPFGRSKYVKDSIPKISVILYGGYYSGFVNWWSWLNINSYYSGYGSVWYYHNPMTFSIKCTKYQSQPQTLYFCVFRCNDDGSYTCVCNDHSYMNGNDYMFTYSENGTIPLGAYVLVISTEPVSSDYTTAINADKLLIGVFGSVG